MIMICGGITLIFVLLLLLNLYLDQYRNNYFFHKRDFENPEAEDISTDKGDNYDLLYNLDVKS